MDVLTDETTLGRGKEKLRKQLLNNAAEPQSAISQQHQTQKAAAAPCSPLALTSQLAEVQGLPQLLQQVGSGRVLLVLLAVVVLLGHHGVVEPGGAQLAVPVRVPALVRRGHHGGTVRVRLLEGAQGGFCRREHSGVSFPQLIAPDPEADPALDARNNQQWLQCPTRYSRWHCLKIYHFS